MIIDTHHHFWNYDPVEFDWIDDEMATIRQSFLPENFKSTIKDTEVTGVVSVQARQIEEETDWLIANAEEHDFIKGVVGWLPLMDPAIEEKLQKYAGNNWLKGIRHVVQGEPDPEFILGDAFNRGVDCLKKFNLVYDILIFEHQLPNTIKFVDKHPNQMFVLDHIAKLRIKENDIENWANNLKELAKRDNVFCKMSGMVTEADYKLWTEEQLKPYFDVVLEAFGPSKLMFGSDWPVCLFATQYNQWLNLVKKVVSGFSQSEQEQIFYKNAIATYHL